MTLTPDNRKAFDYLRGHDLIMDQIVHRADVYLFRMQQPSLLHGKRIHFTTMEYDSLTGTYQIGGSPVETVVATYLLFTASLQFHRFDQVHKVVHYKPK